METFTIESSGRRLPARWHPAASGAARAAVLFCDPLGEEKKSAQRAFYETARALSAEGVASLRFDLSGCGDADGEFEEFSLPDWQDDIAAAWGCLIERAGSARKGLVGLRLGATLAALSCPRLQGVDMLALWQPVIEGKTEFTSELRRLLVQQMMVDGRAAGGRGDIIARLESGAGEVELDGYPVTGRLYRDICGINLMTDRPNLPASSGVVQFSRPNRRIEAFAEAAGIPAVVVDVPPIWTRTDFIPDAETGRRLARNGTADLVR